MLHEKTICRPVKEQSADAVAAAEPPETSSQAEYLGSKSPATPFSIVPCSVIGRICENPDDSCLFSTFHQFSQPVLTVCCYLLFLNIDVYLYLRMVIVWFKFRIKLTKRPRWHQRSSCCRCYCSHSCCHCMSQR